MKMYYVQKCYLCASGMYNKEESKVEKDYEKGFDVCDDGAGIRGAVRL